MDAAEGILEYLDSELIRDCFSVFTAIAIGAMCCRPTIRGNLKNFF